MRRIIHETLHRAYTHAHEIVVALVMEGSRASIFFMLLLIALILIAFAFQSLVKLED